MDTDTLDKRQDGVSPNKQDQNAREPGAESGKEAPEWSKCPMRPDVDGAVNGHEAVELACDDRSRDEKRDSTNHPIEVGGTSRSLGRLYNRGIRDEEDNGNEDSKHIGS